MEFNETKGSTLESSIVTHSGIVTTRYLRDSTYPAIVCKKISSFDKYRSGIALKYFWTANSHIRTVYEHVQTYTSH